MLLSIIAAYAKDNSGARVIGRANQMPWHFSHDLERFREYTASRGVIMGRKTHESIGRILPRRDNIIVSRQADYKVPGAHVFNDLDEAIGFASARHSEAFIIGGQQLYEQCIHRADRLYLTSFKIDGIEGDTYFPSYNSNLYKIIHIENAQISGDCFRILERKITTSTLTERLTVTADEESDIEIIEISGMREEDFVGYGDLYWDNPGYII